MTGKISIGTCSWKYDCWKGLVYPDQISGNYLREYSSHFSTVEVDQWFWSLFPRGNPVLPKPEVLRDYANSVHADFAFGIKVPNSITLTHHYKKKNGDQLIRNPHFLSVDLMLEFLDRLAPLSSNLGPLMFQFEYLNKQKMASQATFLDQLGTFIDSLPRQYTYCIETRNPNYLNERYFQFLEAHGVFHVFLHGYYMPSVFDIYREYRDMIKDLVVIRLHGPDRKGIEDQTGGNWSNIVSPKDRDIETLAEMLKDLCEREVSTFLYVNNHFEGSAPRTISRIFENMDH